MKSRRYRLLKSARPALWLLVALLCSGVAAATQAQQRLGRLFSTPEERANLNELRKNRELVLPDPAPVAQTTEPEPTIEQLSIDGLVIRSSGANSAWINGRQVSGGWTTREGVRVDTSAIERGGRVRITLPSGVDSVDLKPGQKIDVLSGVVVEGYEKGGSDEGPSVFSAPPLDGASPASQGNSAATGATTGSADAGAAPAGSPTRESFMDQIRRALSGG